MISAIDISRFDQLKASGDLPSPKGVALAIIRLTQREETTLGELVQVIKTDPAFVGRLIKAANTGNLTGRRPVASVQDALVVLGLPAVRTLALGFSLLTNYRQGRCRGFDYEAFWSGSLLCALAMQHLAAITHVAQPEETFCVGLLCRVGELALATLFPERYSEVLAEARQQPATPVKDLEHRMFAIDHAELAVALLREWGIPKVLSEPVYYSEDPDVSDFPVPSRQDSMSRSLAVARSIAEICLAPEDRRPAMLPALIEAGRRIGIERDVLVPTCDRITRDWHDWAGMLRMSTQSVPSFEDISRQEPAEAQGETADPLWDGLRQQRMRVLLVDSDATLRLTLRTLLEKAGHEVVEAANGREGLERALDAQPQLIILDWMMPEMDGIQLTRALRQTKIGRSIYILVLTGIEDDERLIEAFESGVDDFLSKPLRPRILAARLRAGQRVVKLQQEVERDREEIRRFAAELAVTNRRLQEVALTDSLTGFPNRRYAMDRIQQDWAATSRNKRPLSCMVIDVDEFKRINDGYGHDVGDTVLRQASAALKQGLRAQDVVCRTGGDEFLVICPDTDLGAALACAERVRRSVESIPIRSGLVHLHASVSIGVAARDATMHDWDDLIKRADQGLYLAKERGRNCVATKQQPGPSPAGSARKAGE